MKIREKKIYISELREGQQLQELFVVARKSLAETKAGKPYLAMGLMDRSGEIEARLWDKAVQYDGQAAEGNFVQVQASVKSYRDTLQLNVVSLQQVEENAVRLEEFMAASPRPLEDMERELKQVLAGLADAPLRNLLQEIFQGENLARFVRAPAAKKMHHAYIGGLIEHTLSLVGLAEKTADHYPTLDRDLLIAGTLLHDVAKIDEFEYSRLPFSYTDRGRLVGHLVLGVEMVRKAAESVSIAEDRVDQLIHIILSHHGRLEFGSPVLPMTPEAILLHHLDDMDAKMNYIDQLRSKMDEPGFHWTDFQRPLERFLYLQSGETDGGEEVGKEAGSRQYRKSSGQPALDNGEAKKRQQSLF